MLEVSFPIPDGPRLRFRVSGHCGAGSKGQDLVCAAVSSLVFTFLGGLEKTIGAAISGTFEESKGLCDVEIEIDPALQSEFTAISRVFRFGFEKLAENFSSHIRLVN